jgi:hypothetical protein
MLCSLELLHSSRTCCSLLFSCVRLDLQPGACCRASFLFSSCCLPSCPCAFSWVRSRVPPMICALLLPRSLRCFLWNALTLLSCAPLRSPPHPVRSRSLLHSCCPPPTLVSATGLLRALMRTLLGACVLCGAVVLVFFACAGICVCAVCCACALCSLRVRGLLLVLACVTWRVSTFCSPRVRLLLSVVRACSVRVYCTLVCARFALGVCRAIGSALCARV